MLERLEVRHVARTRPEEVRHDETRIAASDAARRLNIFRRVFRLTLHEHESEARDVDPYGEHIGGERDVNAGGTAGELPFEAL